MPELSRINPTDLQLQDETSAPLSSVALILASASTPPLSAASLRSLGELMSLAQARYPNQELPPGNETMYLAEWEEMVQRFGRRDGCSDEVTGLQLFADALQRTLRDRDRPQFFPAPEEIETRIREKLRAEKERKKTLDELTRLDVAKTVWMLERAEDVANGIERAPLPARSPQREFPRRHTAQEMAAFVAEHTTPEQLAEVRERMSLLRNQQPEIAKETAA